MSGSEPISWDAEIAKSALDFADGDTAALARLFDLTAGRLLRYAQTFVRRLEDAEDAVQSSIMRIARHPSALAHARLPWAYLLRVVRNESLRVLSRQRASTEFRDDLMPVVHIIGLEEAERATEIQAAIRKLPREQAEVVVLKIWEGLTFQEIASVTNEPQNTVASRYRYALEKLGAPLRRWSHEVPHAG